MTESAGGVTKLPNSEMNSGQQQPQTGIQGGGEEMVHESFTGTSNTDINNTFYTKSHIGGACQGLGRRQPHLG